MKTCNKCNECKDVTEFSKHSKTRDGLQTICKACRALYIAQRRASEPGLKEYSKRMHRKYRESNREGYNAYHRQYKRDRKE